MSETSVHSSRMRTARQSTYRGGMGLGVCLLRGSMPIEGGYADWGGGSSYRGLPTPWHCRKVEPPVDREICAKTLCLSQISNANFNHY